MISSILKISPSLLSSDFSKLGEEIRNLTLAGADYIHFDIMDGHFVPNLTIGPCVVKALRECSKVIFDVHLMITPVEHYIKEFALAGADIITFHAESVIHLDANINLIRSLGKKVGLALVPSTSIEFLEYLIPKLDMVLVMTVNPGFGGQEFINSQLTKIFQIRKMAEKLNPLLDIQVDGGINQQTAKLCVEAGANVLVSGSYIFSGDYQQRISSLKI